MDRRCVQVGEGGLPPIAMSGHHRPSHGCEDANIPWWSEELSPRQLPVPDDTFDAFTSDLSNVFIDTPSIPSNSPASFHTPLSDSYLLPGPLTYNVGRPFPARETPRSMSVSAISHSEQSLPTTAPQIPAPRQIRFVSTDGQPHAKRRRINAACLTCRKRKTRCSGERPECKTCVDTAHVCAGYADRPPRKSGDEKLDDESEEESGTSSPKKPGRNENVAPAQPQRLPPAPIPKFEHTSSLDRPGSDPEIRSPGSNHTVSSTSGAGHR